MRRLFACVFFLFLAVPASGESGSGSGSGARPDLRTTAEQTGWRRTGRYDEAVRLCEAFPKAYPGKAACERFGTTPEGRPMVALVVSPDGVLAPEEARAKGRHVVLFQGGIHAGEIDGKDAGFQALRDLLDGRIAKKARSRITVVFVPVLNVDGHERFGPNHRVNQVGPEEMGWRTTAQNLNLNRDYLKAEAPETAAVLGLLERWDPIVYVDLHVTDGARFRHRIAYLVEPIDIGDPGMRKAGRQLRDGVVRALSRKKHLPIGEFYPSFREDDDPTSGFEVYAAPPRFSTAYWARRNRIGVLVETHSWKDYATRVRATYDSIVATLEQTAAHGDAWAKAAAAADRAAEAGALAAADYALDWKPGGAETIAFQGVAYERRPSEVSGGTWTVYHPEKPEVWRVPLHGALVPSLQVAAPAKGGGYVVPAAQASWVEAKLRVHGLRWTRIEKPLPGHPVEAFRASATEFGAKPFEGRQTLRVEGSWSPGTQDLPAGSLFVPIAQPRARLVLEMFEPMAADSLLAWGFFNAHFERKEYMEGYVAEEVARTMLARDPALKAEFEARIAADEAFARDPRARLDFFYRRHPSWDARLDLYPVMRVSGLVESR